MQLPWRAVGDAARKVSHQRHTRVMRLSTAISVANEYTCIASNDVANDLESALARRTPILLPKPEATARSPKRPAANSRSWVAILAFTPRHRQLDPRLLSIESSTSSMMEWVRGWFVRARPQRWPRRHSWEGPRTRPSW